ncbi:MAG: N-acetylmuramoyl-L-alanine amidase [Blastocatellales bacterium]
MKTAPEKVTGLKAVVVTAGHGGGDPGAVANGWNESELAVWLRDEITSILRGRMVRVITDGQRGSNKPLRDACGLAKSVDGPAAEIHFNAGPPGASGVEVLSNPELKPLAREIARAISTVTRSPLRGDLGWKNPASGQHHRLAFCEAGGLILEVCFMTEHDDLKAYLENKGAVASAIAAILGYAVKHWETM